MNKLFFLAALAISLVFFSCKKDKGGDGAPASIDGYWMGSWKLKSNSAQNELAVVLRNNGTLRILTGFTGGDTSKARIISEETFTYDDGSVTFQSREADYTYSYKGEAKGQTISGTWGELPSHDNGGTWTLNRK